jgi:PAS domain S-box-containing protein
VALKESELRFRFMTEWMPPKVFTADPHGTVTYMSPQWARYTGQVLTDLGPESLLHNIHPNDRAELLRAWRRAMTSGLPVYFEHRLKRVDGVYRWHVIRANARRDAQGAIVEWVCTCTDIEELHESRELESRLTALAQQREQLVRVNKMKDEFIMLASHQLRTPAASVKHYLAMLLQGYSDALTDDQRELLQGAYEGNERQIEIIEDLLRVARLDGGQLSLVKTTCDVVAFVRGIVTETRGVFESRQQTVEFSASQAKLFAPIDASLMHVVFENLLDNASKYSPVGKTVKVSVVKKAESVVVAVQDEGVGIEARDRKRLFQKFSRIPNSLSKSVNGTGLGLYWSKQIVELHGGTLKLTSKVGRGSTFRVELPLVRH